MAMLSGRVLRWALAWVLPLASFLPLTYFGADNAGRYYWWYWPRQPAGQVPCALIAVGFLAVAVRGGTHALEARLVPCCRSEDPEGRADRASAHFTPVHPGRLKRWGREVDDCGAGRRRVPGSTLRMCPSGGFPIVVWL